MLDRVDQQQREAAVAGPARRAGRVRREVVGDGTREGTAVGEPGDFERWVEQPIDATAAAATFERFGLPAALTA